MFVSFKTLKGSTRFYKIHLCCWCFKSRHTILHQNLYTLSHRTFLSYACSASRRRVGGVERHPSAGDRPQLQRHSVHLQEPHRQRQRQRTDHHRRSVRLQDQLANLKAVCIIIWRFKFCVSRWEVDHLQVHGWGDSGRGHQSPRPLSRALQDRGSDAGGRQGLDADPLHPPGAGLRTGERGKTHLHFTNSSSTRTQVILNSTSISQRQSRFDGTNNLTSWVKPQWVEPEKHYFSA